jgi:hypothetical protein
MLTPSAGMLTRCTGKPLQDRKVRLAAGFVYSDMYTVQGDCTVSKGFALPTILIASVVMLVELVTTISLTVAVISSLNTRHYPRPHKRGEGV